MSRIKDSPRQNRPGYLDPDWVRLRMKELKLTFERFATAADFNSISPAQRLVEGKRKIQLAEVDQVADALQVQPSEILKRAGMWKEFFHPLPATKGVADELTNLYGRGTVGPDLGPAGGAGAVVVIGWVDSRLAVHFDGIGATEAAGAAWSGRGNKRAVRFQTMGGNYAAYDGAFALYEEAPAAKDGKAPGPLGRLAVIESGDKAGIGIVGRGSGPGKFHLHGINGTIESKDIAIKSISPILLIRFPAAEE